MHHARELWQLQIYSSLLQPSNNYESIKRWFLTAEGLLIFLLENLLIVESGSQFEKGNSCFRNVSLRLEVSFNRRVCSRMAAVVVALKLSEGSVSALEM